MICAVRIQIHERTNWPTKNRKKVKKLPVFEMLDALIEVLEASPAAWMPAMEASE